MTAPPIRLVFLGQLGAPGRYAPDLFAEEPGGDDEVHWFRLTLERAGLADRVAYEGRRICRGAPLPPAEGADAPDAVVIGGSFHSVHDDLPWQRALVAWLRRLRARADGGPPVFGICGGHQIMARALGAPVERLPDGEMAATLPVELTEAGRTHYLFDGLGDPPSFHFGNEEHVAHPPDGATVLAVRPELPAAALDFGGGWLSVQFHPEAEAESFARGWRHTHPEYMVNYRPVPQTPRIFRNFLEGTGVLSA
ncbi:MAG: type 1 glutamine amidotransferase [Alphaproteobacteria bacterium]|nr:type 1 glutamine amidotransferase [Alphaproteobacteria bacterium]